MSDTIEDRLKELGVSLPLPAAPAANYVPFILEGQQLYVSGQLPMGPSGIAFTGKLGADVSLEDGQSAAQACALNILAQAKAALGDLERIERCLKLGGFVASTADFTEHPAVINGASNFMVDVLGDKGRHTRFAVGCSSLPFNVPVEIDALFSVR